MILCLFWWRENMQGKQKGGKHKNNVDTGNINISHEWMLYGI